MNATEETVFLEALEKSDPKERSGYLQQACGGNAGLRLVERYNIVVTTKHQPWGRRRSCFDPR